MFILIVRCSRKRRKSYYNTEQIDFNYIPSGDMLDITHHTALYIFSNFFKGENSIEGLQTTISFRYCIVSNNFVTV